MVKPTTNPAPKCRQYGLVLAPSRSCRTVTRGQHPAARERGIALVVVMSVIAILTIYLTEMLQNNATAFHVAVSQRDKLKAEYIAKSGLNMTRLLIANEGLVRKTVQPMYTMMLGRPPPQLNVWAFADDLLAPFFSPALAEEMGSGLDFAQMQGIAETGGEISVISVAENSKINVSNALFYNDQRARISLAQQLFSLTGGDQPESPYNAIFEQEDADGQFTSREDVIHAIIDWWDTDQNRTIYDRGAGTITQGGSEDDSYAQLREPYRVKNAPFDSLEELRLVRGIGDDFWANFVEEDPEDPRTRHMTIYGSGAVNPNEATALVILARLCSFVPEEALCRDPAQIAAFNALFETARMQFQVPLFSRPSDFVDFVEGKGKAPRGLYPMLKGLVAMIPGGEQFLAWTPVSIPKDTRKKVEKAFITGASIFTIQATGRVGRASVRISSVVNFHNAWTPPPGVAAKMPRLGIFHHYRVN